MPLKEGDFYLCRHCKIYSIPEFGGACLKKSCQSIGKPESHLINTTAPMSTAEMDSLTAPKLSKSDVNVWNIVEPYLNTLADR